MRRSSLLILPGYIGAVIAADSCDGLLRAVVVMLCCMWIDVMSAIDAKWRMTTQFRAFLREEEAEP